MANMTDCEYFESQIDEELYGACDYVKRAIELKAMDTTMSKTFLDMSAAELSHASALYKMFGDYYKITVSAYTEPPKYIEEAKKRIDEFYPERSAKVLMMHEMYKK